MLLHHLLFFPQHNHLVLCSKNYYLKTKKRFIKWGGVAERKQRERVLVLQVANPGPKPSILYGKMDKS